MLLSPSPQTFGAYAISSVVLCLNLVFLWMYSAVVRAKEKVSPNPEDGQNNKVTVSDVTPPRTARVLRAHANAQASIYPFLILGLVFVLAGGGATTGSIIFAVFCLARWLHSFVYLSAKQPLRTICFLIGMAAIVALLIAITGILIQN